MSIEESETDLDTITTVAGAIAEFERELLGSGGPDFDFLHEGVEWLSKKDLTALEGAELARVFDIKPSAWLRDESLAAAAAAVLFEAGWRQVPRFLRLVSDEFYIAQSRMRFFANDSDNAAMKQRRIFDAARLESAVAQMRESTSTRRADTLLRTAIERPEPLNGDSEAMMAGALLGTLQVREAGAFDWLREFVARKRDQGPFAWLKAAFANLEATQEKAAIRRLRELEGEADWETLVDEAKTTAVAFPTTDLPWMYVVHGYRELGRNDDAEAAAREALAVHPRAIRVLDTVLPALLRGGRFQSALDFWKTIHAGYGTSILEPESFVASLARADRMILGNVVGNIIVLYGQLGHWGEAHRELDGLIHHLSSGLMLGNAACLYAKCGDIDNALWAVEQGLAAGKPLPFFETDDDLASLRELPAFQALLAAARSEADDRADDDDDDDDENGNGSAEDAAPAVSVEKTTALLSSSDVDEVRRGLHDLRQWVRAEGDDVDLGRFGVEESDEDLVDAPVFDAILKRFGDTAAPDFLGVPALLDLVGSLFNSNVSFHSTRASIDAATLVVNAGPQNAHTALVEIYIQACEYYDDGHRFWGESGMDLFIENILANCCAPALVKLMTWAFEHNYTQDLGELLVPTLASGLSDADALQVLEAFEKSIRDGDDGRLYQYEIDAAVNQMKELLGIGSLPASSRAFIERLLGEANTFIAEHKQVKALLNGDDLTTTVGMLEAFGEQVSAQRFEEFSSSFDAILAPHFRDVPPDLMLDALSHAHEAPSIFSILIRLAVEVSPQLTIAELEKTFDGGHAENVKTGVRAANRPYALRSLRHRLRKLDRWVALPMRESPHLTSLLAKWSGDSAEQ